MWNENAGINIFSMIFKDFIYSWEIICFAGRPETLLNNVHRTCRLNQGQGLGSYYIILGYIML